LRLGGAVAVAATVGPSHLTSNTSLTMSNSGESIHPLQGSKDLSHLRNAYANHNVLISGKSKKSFQYGTQIPEHAENRFFVQPGVKNTKSPMKLMKDLIPKAV